MALIAGFIVLGHKYLALPVLALSFFSAVVWRNAPRPWIYLIAIMAASPVVFSQKFKIEPNLIFAIWFLFFNIRYLSKLPKWIYVLCGLVLFGSLSSSINWISDGFVRGLARQGTFAFTYILGVFILLPVVYSRMRESRKPTANLQGLLFCLIIPSTLILLLAKCMGTPTNIYESLLRGIESQGYLMYKIGHAYVNFLRTEVGFILAVLICASTAIAISKVNIKYRLLAGACLASNVFLLLTTGSFGSIFSCLCGLAAIFYTQIRVISVTKVIASVTAICCLVLLLYGLSPPSTKKYLEKRTDYRITKANTDRLDLWEKAVAQIIQHPEGVGWTLSVGDKVKTFIHNDYLTYMVSYGFLGGLAYALLIIVLCISFFQMRKDTVDHAKLAIQLAGFGAIIAVAVNSMTDHMTENRWYFNLIWSLIWYCYFCSRAPSDGNDKMVKMKGNSSRVLIT
jgi:O-antigen ligase